MDSPQFHWGEPIDDVVKHLLLRALTDVCRSVPSYTSSNSRTRKDVYKFIAHQDENTQRYFLGEFQRLLANPTSETCRANWLLKRKMEDEESEIRNVRARLQNVGNTSGKNGKNLPLIPKKFENEFEQVTSHPLNKKSRGYCRASLCWPLHPVT
jgi:hypothetical protein